MVCLCKVKDLHSFLPPQKKDHLKFPHLRLLITSHHLESNASILYEILYTEYWLQCISNFVSFSIISFVHFESNLTDLCLSFDCNDILFLPFKIFLTKLPFFVRVHQIIWKYSVLCLWRERWKEFLGRIWLESWVLLTVLSFKRMLIYKIRDCMMS